MTAYAAYLRIYEPVSAFHEPDRSRWVAYADSATRPQRRDSLAVEPAEALRRAITTPWVAMPERESEHAYIRRVDGITYVCPWQTRLRCLLAYGGLAALRHLPAGSGDTILEPSRVAGDLAEAGRWLEEFHPYSLIELDYGGLVHLVSDDALCGDQSVAEIRAAIDGAARGEHELAATMYMCARNRWRAFAEFELAN